MVIGVLKAFGRRYAAIFMPGATLQIADLIEREQYSLDELGSFIQDCLDHIRCGVFEPRQIGKAFDAEYLVDYELCVPDGRLIAGHDMSF